jgi:hypothetical protein
MKAEWDEPIPLFFGFGQAAVFNVFFSLKRTEFSAGWEAVDALCELDFVAGRAESAENTPIAESRRIR